MFDQLLDSVINKELAQITGNGGKIHLRSGFKRISGFILIGMAVFTLFVFIAILCPSVIGIGILGGVVTAIVTVMKIKKNNMRSTIVELAAKAPDTHIGTLIRNDIMDEDDVKKEKRKVVIAGISMIVFLAVVFVFRNGGIKTTIKYEENPDGGYTLVRYSQAFLGGEKYVEIPSEYNGEPVVEIAEGAMRNNRRIKEIVVPDTVVMIGSYAFENCTSLRSIELSKNLTTMGGACFKNCKSLEEIDLPDTLKELRGENFYKCKSLKRVKLPKYITEIKGNTFEYCESLESIYIPNGVTRIAAHSFFGCTSLSKVRVPVSVEEIGSSAFRECNSLTCIVVPDSADIDLRAFKESPTEVMYMEWMDAEEIAEVFSSEFSEIEKEVSTIDSQTKIEPIYVECDVVNGRKIPTISHYEAFVEFRETNDNSNMKLISTKKEMLSFLKKARFIGVEHAVMLLENEKIGKDDGMTGEVFGIDEIIEAYTSDSWNYETAYKKYAEKNNG